MIVTPIRTKVIRSGSIALRALLDECLDSLDEGSILAITSKIVSLCEGNTVPIGSIEKAELIEQQSSYYLPNHFSKYGYRFTITKGTLIATAGIDESNGGGNYILWPKDPQASVNMVRTYLQTRFGVKKVGVIITDSASKPTRFGTVGIALAHSGFKALRSYIGQPDLFGKLFSVSRANIAEGLAAAAVVAMGEGAQQTPLVLISGADFVEFQDRNPSTEELSELRVSIEDDFFEPFLNSVGWQPGGQKTL